MSFSSGTYSLPGPALNTGDTVSATENNAFRNDVATAFNLTWLRNGTAAATADIPMGGFSFTNCAAVGSAGSLLLKTNGGTTAVTLDTAQNVGVGVVPSAWFSGYKAIETGSGSLVYPGAATNTQLWSNLYVNTSGNVTYKTTGIGGLYSLGGGGNAHTWYYAASGTAGTTASLTQAMTLDASGNLLLGTTSISNSGMVIEKSNAEIRLQNSGGTNRSQFYSNSSGLTFGTVDNNPVVVRTNATEVARFDSSGNLLVGDTSAVGKIYSYVNSSTLPAMHARQDGTAYIQDWVIAAGATKAYIKVDGGLGNYSANNVNLSDERMKTDISLAGSYLAKICAIPVKTFKYKDQTDDLLNLGVIAQDVEAVAPELVDVSGWGAEVDQPEDGVPLKAIYQTDLQYALMKCIQEQQALITTLTERITALENK